MVSFERSIENFCTALFKEYVWETFKFWWDISRKPGSIVLYNSTRENNHCFVLQIGNY